LLLIVPETPIALAASPHRQNRRRPWGTLRVAAVAPSKTVSLYSLVNVASRPASSANMMVLAMPSRTIATAVYPLRIIPSAR